MDSGEKNETPRIIALTDEEKKSFESSNPGDDLECIVHGSMAGDGKFRVMSVTPSNPKGYGGESEMAGMVAQKVQPMTQISPS
jgi:hypothetical protein